MSFELYVKSTIDRMAYDISVELGVTKLADLDDTVNLASILANDEPAIVWQLITLDPSPRDPLYQVQFGIGAKTTADPANYKMMSLVAAMQHNFEVGSRIVIKDYSTTTPPTTDKGYLTVTEAPLSPQEFDNESGLRMYTVTGRAMRSF